MWPGNRRRSVSKLQSHWLAKRALHNRRRRERLRHQPLPDRFAPALASVVPSRPATICRRCPFRPLPLLIAPVPRQIPAGLRSDERTKSDSDWTSYLRAFHSPALLPALTRPHEFSDLLPPEPPGLHVVRPELSVPGFRPRGSQFRPGFARRARCRPRERGVRRYFPWFSRQLRCCSWPARCQPLRSSHRRMRVARFRSWRLGLQASAAMSLVSLSRRSEAATAPYRQL